MCSLFYHVLVLRSVHFSRLHVNEINTYKTVLKSSRNDRETPLVFIDDIFCKWHLIIINIFRTFQSRSIIETLFQSECLVLQLRRSSSSGLVCNCCSICWRISHLTPVFSQIICEREIELFKTWMKENLVC